VQTRVWSLHPINCTHIQGKCLIASKPASDEHPHTLRPYFRTGGLQGKTRSTPTPTPPPTKSTAALYLTRWRTFMKKSILLVFLFLAAALAGCSHPNDITDDVASAAVATAQA
jgi:hypothetical protein